MSDPASIGRPAGGPNMLDAARVRRVLLPLLGAGILGGGSIGYLQHGIYGLLSGGLIGGLTAVPVGLGFMGLTVVLARLLMRLQDRARLGRRQQLVEEVCRSDSRRELARRFQVVKRLAYQYEPPAEERQALEQVSRLYRQRRSDEAEAHMRRVVEAYPDSPYVAARRARLLLQELRCEEAEAAVRRALETHPEEVSLRILEEGVDAAKAAPDRDTRVAAVQSVLARMVDWAGIQVDLILRETKQR